MSAKDILDDLIDLLSYNFEMKENIKERLYYLIKFNYNGSLEEFLNKEVINYAYGQLTDDIIKLYNDYLDYLKFDERIEKITCEV